MGQVVTRKLTPPYRTRVLLKTDRGWVIGERTHTDENGEHYSLDTKSPYYASASAINIDDWEPLPDR
jgi:hypothetical protein